MPKSLALVALAVLAAASCRPSLLDETEDYDAIATVRQPGRDFDDLETFTVPDAIIDLAQFIDAGEADDLTHEHDALILETIVSEMEARGYEYKEDAELDEVDVHFVVGSVQSDNWVFYGYYPWYPYWGSYGWYYYYPPVVGAVSFTFGSVIISMVKPDEREPLGQRADAGMGGDGEQAIPVIWAAGLRGLVDEDSGARRIEAAIKQAFLQSPYLGEVEGDDR